MASTLTQSAIDDPREYVIKHWLRIELKPGIWLQSVKTGKHCVIFSMQIDFMDENNSLSWYPTMFELLEVGKTEPRAYEAHQLYRFFDTDQMKIFNL